MKKKTILSLKLAVETIKVLITSEENPNSMLTLSNKQMKQVCGRKELSDKYVHNMTNALMGLHSLALCQTKKRFYIQPVANFIPLFKELNDSDVATKIEEAHTQALTSPTAVDGANYNYCD